jgi:hypothetical protein
MLQGLTHLVSFSRAFSFLRTNRTQTFRNFKRPCIMLYDKPWEQPSAVATLPIVILLSAPINSSTSLQHGCFCRNLIRATWSGITCDFRRSLREFLDSVVNRFTRQTLPTVKQETLLYGYPLHCVLFPTKKKNRARERLSLVVHSSTTVAIFTTETNL